MYPFNTTQPTALNREALASRADQYLNHLAPVNKPKLVFVSLPEVKEATVNDRYSDPDAVFINCDFFYGMAVPFVEMIVFHELYHFCVHRLCNSHCVAKLRDDKRWELMQAADIEADVDVALYLQAGQNVFGFAHYLTQMHVGSKTFHDAHMRYVKLERFIGSLISVRAALEGQGKAVHLPAIHPCSLSIHTTDFQSCRFRFQWLNLDQRELKSWMRLYQHAANMSCAEYVELAMRLTSNLLAAINMQDHETRKIIK